MSYRNDVDALAARHDALATEVAAKTRELDDAARLLTEAKARAKLPVLDNIRVATPCNADWAKMSGDERVRMCGSCSKHVYNLSDMTRDEAERLLVAKEGRLCVRYYQRADGTILTKDCAVGISQRRKRRVIAASAAALLAGVGGLLAARLLQPSCTATAPEPGQLRLDHPDYRPAQTTSRYAAQPPEHVEIRGEVEVVMGDVAVGD